MSEEKFSENKRRQPSHIAYRVEEGKDDRNHWQKIGAAWPARNDGLTLKLSAIPLDGTVVLRSREELERLRAERQNATSDEPKQEVNPKL